MLNNPKEYPKAVVMRKGIIGVVAVAVILIILLVMHNLNETPQQNGGSEANKKGAQHKASASIDANWFKDQEIRRPVVMPENKPPQPAETPSMSADMLTAPAITAPAEDKEARELAKKAMAAPIGSNQLTGDLHFNSDRDSNISSSSNMQVSPAGNKNEEDPNKQAEKKAFLQMSGGGSDFDDYLHRRLRNAISPYEVKAGTVIPGVMISGINSDLPGQMVGQIRQNVYDTIAGRYVVIPQGAKLIGTYDSMITYGQKRVLVIWKRIIFPNGQSINLEGMPGGDLSGYAGFEDLVNNHYLKIFGSAILLSIISAGAQLSQPNSDSSTPFAYPTVGQTLAQSLGTNISNTADKMTKKNLDIQPTLVIRPGYLFNIMVTKDMVFPGPYSPEVHIGGEAYS